MTEKSIFWIIGILLLGVSLLGAGRAEAGRYASSKSPYWDVGALSPLLSNACQKRAFNQIEPYRLNIGFDGGRGNALTGIAKMGWNLYDPKGLAQPGYTYHFFNDGQSNCKVYQAGSRLTR